MDALEKFRAETREWLGANCPASMRTPMKDGEEPWGGRNAVWKNPDSKIWMERMAERGWTAPTWPKEYGGGGLSKEENMVLQQEMRRIHARTPLMSFGLWMLGPALLEFANEEQKKEHIPPIVRGEIRWCQGYSEPGAGSDLAGLQTKCEDKGDHYLVNGQKIWTSYADKADFRNRARARTLPAFRPNAKTRATITSSTARRSGRLMQTRPTGFSAWCAPTRPKSMKAFPSC